MQDFSKLAEKWPSTIVMRNKVKEFSGGALHPRTLANRDSAGTGPRGRFTIHGRVGYPVESLIEYLHEQLESEREVKHGRG